MKENHYFSIIISAYNIEDYIQRAINSVINQDYKNFELIVVNDGSTDKTKEKIETFKSHNIIIIDNKQNKGLGASRNHAVKKARGDYILYLDGDDTMYDKHTLTRINEVLQKKKKVDIAFFGVKYIGGSNATYLSNAENSTKEARLSCDIFFGVPSKCWRTEFLKENHITFIENMYYEDMVYSMKATLLAQELTYGEFPIFNYYRNRPGSIMSSPNIKRCIDMYKMLAHMMELYEMAPEEYKKYILSFIKNETASIPMRLDCILEAMKEHKLSPILPKRNYKLIE
mgnify:CR=1 FL=1